MSPFLIEAINLGLVILAFGLALYHSKKLYNPFKLTVQNGFNSIILAIITMVVLFAFGYSVGKILGSFQHYYDQLYQSLYADYGRRYGFEEKMQEAALYEAIGISIGYWKIGFYLYGAFAGILMPMIFLQKLKETKEENKTKERIKDVHASKGFATDNDIQNALK